MNLQYKTLEKFAYEKDRFEVEQKEGQPRENLIDRLAQYDLFAADRNRLDVELYMDNQFPYDIYEVTQSQFYQEIFEFMILQDYTFEDLQFYTFLSSEIHNNRSLMDLYQQHHLRIYEGLAQQKIDDPFNYIMISAHFKGTTNEGKTFLVLIEIHLEGLTLDVQSTSLILADDDQQLEPFPGLTLKWQSPSLALLLFFLRKIPLRENRHIPIDRVEEYFFTRRADRGITRELIPLGELGSVIWQPATTDTLPGWNLETSETLLYDIFAPSFEGIQ